MDAIARMGYALILGTGLTAGLGCQGFFEQPDGSRPVRLRVENATSDYLQVAVAVSELDSDSSADTAAASVGEPVEVSAGRDVPLEVGVDPAARLALSDGVVRVFPQSITEGEIECGELIRLSAALEGGSSGVALVGAGAGTLGFDEGSAGPSGERFLLSSVDFECGDTVVIRVTDTGGLGANASGSVAVFAPGEVLPPPDAGGSPVQPPAGGEQIEVRVSNGTGSYAQLRIMTAAEAEAALDEAGEVGVTVRVPPGLLSTGVVACASGIVFEAAIVVPGVAVGEVDTFNQAVLSGEGTGTTGFDENSSGVSNQHRLLIEGVHFECGGVIQVDFTSDGDPGTANETLAAATVSRIE